MRRQRAVGALAMLLVGVVGAIAAPHLGAAVSESRAVGSEPGGDSYTVHLGGTFNHPKNGREPWTGDVTIGGGAVRGAIVVGYADNERTLSLDGTVADGGKVEFQIEKLGFRVATFTGTLSGTRVEGTVESIFGRTTEWKASFGTDSAVGSLGDAPFEANIEVAENGFEPAMANP